MKTCVTCKHFDQRTTLDLSRCQSPNNGQDPLDGRIRSRFAENNRNRYGVRCAPEGRWWESKEDQPVTTKPKKENHMFRTIVAFILGFLFAMLVGTLATVMKTVILFAMVGVPLYIFLRWLNKQTSN